MWGGDVLTSILTVRPFINTGFIAKIQSMFLPGTVLAICRNGHSLLCINSMFLNLHTFYNSFVFSISMLNTFMVIYAQSSTQLWPNAQVSISWGLINKVMFYLWFQLSYYKQMSFCDLFSATLVSIFVHFVWYFKKPPIFVLSFCPLFLSGRRQWNICKWKKAPLYASGAKCDKETSFMCWLSAVGCEFSVKKSVMYSNMICLNRGRPKIIFFCTNHLIKI